MALGLDSLKAAIMEQDQACKQVYSLRHRQLNCKAKWSTYKAYMQREGKITCTAKTSLKKHMITTTILSENVPVESACCG